MVDHTDGKKYYFGTDGAMATKMDKQYVTYKGVTYEVGEDGACIRTGESINSISAKYRGIPSPYVYSGTNVYSSGKYVSDGKYNTDAVDRQPGVYLLVTALLEI